MREHIYTDQPKIKFTLDYLEGKQTNKVVAAEYITSKILEEIKFYDTFRPFEFIKSEVFGQGSGMEGEHLLPVALNLKVDGFSYKDEFDLDIVNPDNM